MQMEKLANWLGALTGWLVSRRRKSRSCRRRSWGCLGLFLLLLVLACGLLFWGLAAAQVQASDTPDPLSIYLLIDHSNSMFEKGGVGSDPDLLRIDAARLFISYLGVDDALVSHACSVIFFGSQAQTVVPMTQLNTDQQRQAIFQHLQDPPRMGWTDPTGALELALADLPDANSRPVLVLLTDGKPEWGYEPTEAEREAYSTRLRQMSQALSEAKIPIFIILLANQATDADPEIETIWTPIWQGMTDQTPPGRFYVARQPTDLMDIYHDIVVALTGSRTAGPIVQADVGAAGLRQTVSVEPNLARLTFVASKSDPSLTVSILQPDGTPITATLPNVRHAGEGGSTREEVWVIDNPPAGNWTVLISGAGRVTVWKDYRPAPVTPTPVPTAIPSPTMVPSPSPTTTPAPILIIDGVPPAQLVGQMFTVTARLRPEPNYPVTFQLALKPPVGEMAMFTLLDDGRLGDTDAGDNIYSGQLVLSEPGEHGISVQTQQGNRLLARGEARILGEAAPSLVVAGLDGLNQLRHGDEIQFRAEWRLGGQPVQPDSQLTFGPNQAQLILPDAETVAVSLEPAGYGAFLGETTLPAEGEILLTVVGEAMTASGQIRTQQARQQLVVGPPLPVGRWAALCLLGLSALSGGVYHKWRQRQPIVTGTIRVVSGPGFTGGQSNMELDGLRQRAIQIGAASAVPIPGATGKFIIRVGLPLPGGHEMLISGDEEVTHNQRPLRGERPLHDGDEINLGMTKLRYENLRLRRVRRQAEIVAGRSIKKPAGRLNG